KHQQGSIIVLFYKIRERRPKLRRLSRQDQPEKSLDVNQINHLLEVIKSGAAFNPFCENLQIRNRLIILVLYS
ncbi:site-specific integrase, partial [Klebsiella pneumoniae]|nr:site-specific integrase [Klebsiella pneumoniae]